MKRWYSRSSDVKMRDNKIKKEYHLVFETDSKEIKDKIEAFYKELMEHNDDN